jgi:hypothetical protein
MKLTKKQAQLHQEACALVALARDLSEDEREFVLDHWQESATSRNVLDGAFFTPADLASDLAIELRCADKILDLCAGIGRLAWQNRDFYGRRYFGEEPRELVCVEKNPAYVEVGRKVLPEARWICADVLDVPSLNLGRFDAAIGNPPFGTIARSGNGPRYSGPLFEYHVIDVAAQVAKAGVFIVPQLSAPFRLSGVPFYTEELSEQYRRFAAETGINLTASCIDTSMCIDEWRGVAPRTEVVLADFTETGRPLPVAKATAPARRPKPVRSLSAPPQTADTLF